MPHQLPPHKLPPSHLDIEQPLFSGKPHIWVQWKGTNVCADIYCECGFSGHFDGYFLYFFKCPQCNQVWEVGTHVSIYKVTDERVKGAIVQEVDE